VAEQQPALKGDGDGIVSDSNDERLKAAARESADKIAGSSAFLVLFNERMIEDPMPLLQMGLAIYMDKPIALIVPEGATLPNNLCKLAERIEYYESEDEASVGQAVERLKDWLKATGRRVQ
jgi:hypothetical protein